jgi:hypothetical protein
MKDDDRKNQGERGGTLKGEEDEEEIKNKDRILTEMVEIAVTF